MPRLSMNQLTTYRWSLDEDLYHYREAGYDGVGLWLRKLEDFGIERGLELLADSGLQVSNLLWAGGFTGSDGERFEANLARSLKAIRLAGAMRAGSLVLYTGGRNHHTQRHAQRLLRTAIDRLLPEAEAARVPLAIEPMHPACAREWTFLDSLESALRLVQSYDTPWLSLVYDSYHFPITKPDWSLLRELIPHTTVVHLGDSHVPHDQNQTRCPLGSGQTPLAELISEIMAAGYKGYFDIELLGLDMPANNYRSLIEDSKLMFESYLAAHKQAEVLTRTATNPAAKG